MAFCVQRFGPGLRLVFPAFFVSIACLGTLIGATNARAAEPGVETPSGYGYSGFDNFVAQVNKLKSEGLAVESLGQTAQGRDVLCLTLAEGDPRAKPAIAVLGAVDARQIFASDLVLAMAQKLAAQSKTDPAVKELLAATSFYFIPRPSPDACERLFTAPFGSTATNLRPFDDDSDGFVDEDGPDDLNGDGWITSMRVKDGGAWTACPLDARVLMQADAGKGEQGEYSLYTEGRDDDGDGRFNEDGPGGTDFNRNFTFAYPYFQADAGPHQVSEPETRAVADFLFSRNNIAAVFCISPQDNLANPWQPNQGAEGQPVKKTLLTADKPAYEHICKLFSDTLKPAEQPGSDDWSGSFAPWSYFHYGRWTLSSRGWWIPKVEPPKPPEPEAGGAELARPAEGDPDTAGRDKPGPSEPAASESAGKDEPGPSEPPVAGPAPAPVFDASDGRVKDLLNALRWFEQDKVPGFCDWTAVAVEGFHGKPVEVGGFRDFYRQNPPAAAVGGLADKNLAFLLAFCSKLPRLSVDELRQEPLGSGVWRITARLSNGGYLPTMCAMGETNNRPYPLQLRLSLPDGAQLITGLARQRIGRLGGSGGNQEISWLISAPQGGRVAVELSGPASGSASAGIELSAGGTH